MFYLLSRILIGSCLWAVIVTVVLQNVYSERINITNLRNKRQSDNIRITCELPPYPINGKWSVITNGDGRNGIPGDVIVKNTVIKYECHPNYKLSSSSLFVCDADWTRTNFPICERKCPPKYSTATTFIKCDDQYGREVPCDEAVDGTFLNYSCNDFYEHPLGYKKFSICEEGKWDFNPICQPVCGKKIDKDTVKLVYEGVKGDKREYPWIVAIFQRSISDLATCGASIISQNVIMTAAHCVSDDVGKPLPSEEFIVGVGKYYTKFQHPRDKNIQYVDIDKIVVSSGYSGPSKRFLEDIALLITKELIIFNEKIQPVCYQDLPSVRIHPRQIGVVAGWGRTESGKQPEELRTLEIPYKYEETCTRELPKEWALLYYTNDKICSGFFKQNKSLCPGDSGSGLFFENLENGRYYIHGIVSVGPAIDGQCDPQQNSLYTKVASYYDFIIRVVTKEHVEPCILPMHPEHGKWSIQGQNKKPGDIVPSTSLLSIECDQSYKLSSTNTSIDCGSARNLPKCEKLCPKPSFPKIITYKCKNNNGKEIDCSQATHGSSLVYSCPVGYKLSGTNIILCKNGTWERTPECVDTIVRERYIVCMCTSWYLLGVNRPEYLNSSLCTHIIFTRYTKNIPYGPGKSDFSGKRGENVTKEVMDFKTMNKNVKVLLSLESISEVNHYISSIEVADQSKKDAAVSVILHYIEYYNFDGLNIFWDYLEGTDKMKYIELLQDVKKLLSERGFILTTFVQPYSNNTDYYKKELFDLSDFIIMNKIEYYDPPSRLTGQHSALYPSSLENDWERKHLNIDAAAKNLISKGVPKSKIVLTVGFFSFVVFIEDVNRYGIQAPVIDKKDERPYLRSAGQRCLYKGYSAVWDNEQKSVYAHYDDRWIGYENKISLRIKAAYAKDNGFLGINVWTMEGDDYDGECGTKHNLLKEINRVLRDNFTVGD